MTPRESNRAHGERMEEAPTHSPEARAGVRRVVIHGVGLIGGSIGLAARRHGLADEVVGVGRDPARLETARALGAIDRAVPSGDLLAACREADLIVLCTPVSMIARDLPAVLDACGRWAVVTDVGSVKGMIVEAAGGDPRFVGSHPMAGSERAGVEAARVNLFQEAVWALTPVETTSPDALALVRRFAQQIGATTRILSPQRHDEAVAVTSHLPHVIAYSLMALAGEFSETSSDLPHLAAGSFAGATRVASSLPSLWTDIALSNRLALLGALEGFQTRMEVFRAALESADAEALSALFAAGHDARESWPR